MYYLVIPSDVDKHKYAEHPNTIYTMIYMSKSRTGHPIIKVRWTKQTQKLRLCSSHS